jgi:beta-galactosidase
MKPAPVTADSRSISVHGQRRLVISGEIHYARVPRTEWERVLDRTREAGVNCVALYVFWNVHEPQPDQFDFSGQADLSAFLRLCQERGLDCIVRLGPYCCAEWNYGGFPSWLRDIPGIVLRTWNEPYIERVKKYFRVLVPQILPHLASNGGNVILVQVENEYNNIAKRYGADGPKYLAWIVGYVKSLGIDVPTITCEGGAPGAIEGVNGFSVHEAALKHRQKHPDMPLLWTENWPSWYDTWGYEHHVRDPYEIGYEVLRFLAVGGSGFNYYMWHGGTNFGRTTMYLQTTSYGFDAPLNEWGEPTEKSRVLARLHRGLLACQELLLSGKREETFRSEDGKAFSITWKNAAEKCVLTVNAGTESRRIEIEGARPLLHPATSACLWKVEKGVARFLWKSWAAVTKKKAARSPRWKPVAASNPWLSFLEPKPSDRKDGIASREPIEQLLLTHDASDYCWYAADVSSTSARRATLHLERGGDFFHVFVNGRLADQTKGQLQEVRGPTVSAKEAAIIPSNPLEESVLKSGKNGYEHTFSIPLNRGTNRIEILACALGLIKGDWQLALSMQYERKGIWDTVSVDGKRIRNWRHYPGLIGEELRLDRAFAGEFPLVAWKQRKQTEPLTWHLQQFSLSTRQLQPNLVWAFDAAGVEKGMLWLNGHGIGRVWQIPAHGIGADPLPPIIGTTGPGGPTQRYYRIPSSWLSLKNRLVFFSETGAKPAAGALVCRPYLT